MQGMRKGVANIDVGWFLINWLVILTGKFLNCSSSEIINDDTSALGSLYAYSRDAGKCLRFHFPLMFPKRKICILTMCSCMRPR